MRHAYRSAEARSILIVEDEVLLAKAMTRYLQIKGYETETFADGALALERLKEKPFDVLITDLKLPKVRGEVLAEWGLRHGRLGRVVVISGDNLAKGAIRGARGRVRCVQKPFDLEELVRCFGEIQATAPERRRKRGE